MPHNILLNEGGRLLSNDGADNFIVLNAGAELHGVNIENIHATQDLRGIGRRRRRRVTEMFPIEVYGRIVYQNRIETYAKLLRERPFKTVSKILTESVPKTTSKVYTTTLLEVKSKIMILQHRVKEVKMKKIKKLYDEYKQEFDG